MLLSKSLKIVGGKKLQGSIKISGAKNLALPALSAGIMTSENITLNNVPKLTDISSMIDLLQYLGSNIEHIDNVVQISTKNVVTTCAPYDFVSKMRASILVLGPLVARFKKARVSLPGGCAIGVRGVDMHVKALIDMGADITISGGDIDVVAKYGLHGTDVVFPFPTFTGTENIVMAACLAKGRTVIVNAAVETEVEHLCLLLRSMGAQIDGIGTSVLTIDGVNDLGGCTFDIIPDRIEAGTYAVAAVVTHGDIVLEGARHDHLRAFLECLKCAGADVCDVDTGIRVAMSGDILPIDIETAPYPGFPTDLQGQFMAAMCLCNGSCVIRESVFENRFMHVQELCRMGANINVSDRCAHIVGVDKLVGARVMASDLRASAALVLAGLSADGVSIVDRLYHLYRGYEAFYDKLAGVGADVELIS